MAKRAKVLTKSATIEIAPGLPTDKQVIYCGDNLDKLKTMPSGFVDLIYIDPPFNSDRNYEVFWGEHKEKRSFEDRHESTDAYLRYMLPRCEQLYRVLSPTGSFYYHCDWHASHYVKVMLDRIFGENNFQNEIVWRRTGAHNDPRRYGANFDSIFYYTKSKVRTWNRQYTPYTQHYIDQNYRYKDENGRRFRVSDMTANKPGGDVSYEWTTPTGQVVRPYKGRYWAYSKEKMKAMEVAGQIYYRRTGMPMLKHYLDEMPGVPLQAFWDDIDGVISGSAERVGYPTQKPLQLLDRVINASSNPDDIVLDAFCGCGTALEVAENLGRRWIGIDVSPTACRVMSSRLQSRCGLREGRDFFVRDLPKTPEQLMAYPPFEFENWAVNALNTVLVNGRAIANRAKVNDKGIDGRIYPINADRKKVAGFDLFGQVDDWLPVQVKQKEKAGRQDIDLFETAMRRQHREKGFFVSFDFTSDAKKEIDRVKREVDGMEIIPITVDEILAEEVRYRV
ncbi:DNA methyltransferase [Singulisphaera sp. PoT]|uniref:DNA methyltransferase n=1 Tax=Singulisphaera sp. PoT TaxID=3411797 RepID=UPI003BF4687F